MSKDNSQQDYPLHDLDLSHDWLHFDHHHGDEFYDNCCDRYNDANEGLDGFHSTEPKTLTPHTHW